MSEYLGAHVRNEEVEGFDRPTAAPSALSAAQADVIPLTPGFRDRRRANAPVRQPTTHNNALMATGYNIEQAKVKISVASECNLNCKYCSKVGTIGADCSRDISTTDILAVCEALYAKGYRHAYLGGGGYGEPLLAKDTLRIATALRSTGYSDVTLVTNGTLLEGQCARIADAGITACNISLDTLDPRIYSWLCGSREFSTVTAGIAEAARTFSRVKVITVLLRNINDIEIPDMIAFCKGIGAELQFNELVNLLPSTGFYDAHYLDPAFLLEQFDRVSPYVETIKRDAKKRFHMNGIVVTIRLTKAYANFAIREDSPILRPDGTLVWLSHDNPLFNIHDFRAKRPGSGETDLREAISDAIDDRLCGVTFDTLRHIESCGSFSRASW